ncbi:hypothetical protein ACQPU1_04690 [Clostridium paraputrificum]|uniref:hypothetical protein n=1 Tax=Clostridium paraputrificum TaxID=29363 RepID=UPI003D33FC4D
MIDLYEKGKKYGLDDDHLDVLYRINSKLSSTIISESFCDDVLSDLLDLFSDNQKSGRRVTDITGTNINKFIDEIADSYFSTISRKNIFSTYIMYAFIYSLAYTPLSALQGVPISSTLVLSVIGFMLGLLVCMIIHKCKLSKSKLVNNICFFILAGYPLSNFIYENFSFFSKIETLQVPLYIYYF